MHLSTKKLALLGVLLAVLEVILIVSSIIEVSTLFLLAAASYLVGVAIHETNIKYGLSFYIASILLSVILIPNKFYGITYAVLGLYILCLEGLRLILRKKDKWMPYYRVLKFILFNVIYIPILVWFPQLLFGSKIEKYIYIAVFLGGQLGFYIYDYAYDIFIFQIWWKFRKKFHL